MGGKGILVSPDRVEPAKEHERAHEHWVCGRVIVSDAGNHLLAHGISTRIMLTMKTCQEYVFEGRSRASYRSRAMT